MLKHFVMSAFVNAPVFHLLHLTNLLHETGKSRANRPRAWRATTSPDSISALCTTLYSFNFSQTHAFRGSGLGLIDIPDVEHFVMSAFASAGCFRMLDLATIRY